MAYDFAKNLSALKENPFHVIDFNHVFTTIFDTFKILYTKSVTYVPSYVPYDPWRTKIFLKKCKCKQ